MKPRLTLVASTILAAGTMTSGGAALAQESSVQLEDIVVTAQKRAENMQEVPAAISAIAASELQSRGIANTTDLMGSMPNLQVTSAYGTTQPNFSLRGISVANEFSASTASPVGVYVDEVYQSFRAAHGQQLYDLERVEVLRGPQGTLYGRNTTGGAVNFITRKPKLEEGVSGYVTAGYGNYDAWTLSGALETTIVPDKFGIRVAGTRSVADGYTYNPTLDKHFGETDSIAGRMTALFKPTEELSVTLKLYAAKNDPLQDLPYGIGYLEGRTDSGGYSRFAPRPELGGRTLKRNEVQADAGGTYYTASRGGSLTVEYDFENVTLTSITGYDYGKYRLSPYDCDGSPNDVCSVRYATSSKNFNQDFRLTYDGERLKLIGGAYYGRDKIATENEPDFFGFLRPVLTDMGLPGSFSNVPIAVGNSISTIPAFALDPTLTPADPGYCAPVVVNPNGYFDARTLMAFNADVQANNAAGVGAAQLACYAAGAAPFAPIMANQQFEIARPSFALYGEAKYEVTDQFSVTLGLRYTWDKVKYQNARTIVYALDGTTPIASLVPYSYPYDPNAPAVNQKESTGRLTGRLVLDYKFTDDVMAYASYSRGYRSGSYNGLAYQDISQVYFVPPEKVDAYEVGVKSRFLDNRVQLNVAGFYYDYANQQIAQIIGATSFLRSASGRVFGGEAELVAQVTDTLKLDASLGLLNTKYKGNTIADPNDPASPQLTMNINGNPFPNAPKVTFAAGFDWTAWEQEDRKVVLRGDTQYMGKYYFDPFKDYGQSPCDQPASGSNVLLATPELACGNPSYWLFNARLTYETERYSISVWGKNLTNKFYYVYGLNLNAFYQDYLTRGAPRTYGLEATVRF